MKIEVVFVYIVKEGYVRFSKYFIGGGRLPSFITFGTFETKFVVRWREGKFFVRLLVREWDGCAYLILDDMNGSLHAIGNSVNNA